MTQYLEDNFDFAGGVNSTDSPLRLQPGQLAAALNFLFDSKEVFTRPGVSNNALTGIAAGRRAFWAFAPAGTLTGLTFVQGVNLLVVADGVNPWRWYFVTGNTATEITGPGFVATTIAFGSSDFTAAFVNNVILLGTSHSTDTVMRWDPAAGAIYTSLAGVNYKYMVGHLNRGVGAYETTSFAPGKQKVGWSASGDETTWTGATNGSGSTLLIETPDDITGLCVLHDNLAVCRRYGFTLAYPTGLAFPAYRFETWSRSGAGVYYPETLAVNNNMAFFVGKDDVYTFDLQSTKAIGYAIRKQLFRDMHNLTDVNSRYVGTLIQVRGGGIGGAGSPSFTEPRVMYILTPCCTSVAGNLTENVSVYAYDILEDKWSVHNYKGQPGVVAGSMPSCAYNQMQMTVIAGKGSDIDQSYTYFDQATPPNQLNWRNDISCENTCTITLPRMVLGGNKSQDVELKRVLLTLKDIGTLNGITLTLTATNHRASAIQTKVVAVATGSAAGSGHVSIWFDFNGMQAGQLFDFTLSVPTTSATAFKVELDSMMTQAILSGEHR